jgi:membrane-associated protease RseP (regulator of RpoE activity)
VGLVQVGSYVGEVDPGALVSLFVLINIFIGMFNLIPLLPLDGGHVAIAVYEKIQERRLNRRRYFTDVAKLMPLTYGVVVVLGVLFVSSVYLDIANPLVS